MIGGLNNIEYTTMDTSRLFRPWPSIQFHFGTMAAGKSLHLLIAAHQLSLQNVNYCVMTAIPKGVSSHPLYTEVSSRSGLPPHKSWVIFHDSEHIIPENVSHILIDEAQFLTKEHVEELRNFVDMDATFRVDCYGLKTDFKGELFAGSLELMRSADELIEISSMCSRCNRPATYNLRLDKDENTVKSGDQVALKEDTRYVAVCRQCWRLA
tara:strand:+ start:222 stop:851 length:630 start_codon:yes stop_codon:yes gene_type:complete